MCHIATLLGIAGTEEFATDILTHSAYLMYCRYHLRSEMSRKDQTIY